MRRSGVFYLDLRKPGTYRISFIIGDVGPLSGGTITVGSEEVQRRFAIGRPAPDVYFETQVDTAAKQVPGRLNLRYPDNLMSQETSGQVILSFVIDAAGRPEMKTVKVLLTTHPAFTRSAMVGLPAARYVPAILDGRRVRQLTQLPFVFCASRTVCPEQPSNVVWVRAGWSPE